MTSSSGSLTPAPEITRGDPKGASGLAGACCAEGAAQPAVDSTGQALGVPLNPGPRTEPPTGDVPTAHQRQSRHVSDLPLIRCLNTLADEIMGVPAEGVTRVVAESAEEMTEALNRDVPRALTTICLNAAEDVATMPEKHCYC